MAQITIALSRKLKPICPRDGNVMHYEGAGIRWKDNAGILQTLPSYHCDYCGCSVRYDPHNGYFTVIEEPYVPFFLEEPGTNLLQCPRHGAWLCHCNDETDHAFVWRCGVEGCDYVHTDVPGIWLRQ